jgi:hypothetical protein
VHSLIRIFILLEIRYSKTQLMLLIISLLCTNNALIKRLTHARSICRKKFDSYVRQDVIKVVSKINSCLISWKTINKKKNLSINYLHQQIGERDHGSEALGAQRRSGLILNHQNIPCFDAWAGLSHSGVALSSHELPWEAMGSLGWFERPLRFADVIIKLS